MAIDFTTGVLQIANFILAIVAGFIAASLIAASNRRELSAWKPLAFALIFFAIEQIFGSLRSFNIYSNPWITHVIPSIIFAFLIYALIVQINVVKEGGS